MEATDFFDSQFGNIYDLPTWRQRSLGVAADYLYQTRLLLNHSYRELTRRIPKTCPRKVLITAVEVPERSADLHHIIASLSKTRHDIDVRLAPLREGNGKFQNINAAIRDVALHKYDWLLVIDDDIAVPRGFLDKFIFLSEEAGLRMSQPAHRFRSYQSYSLTQRCWNSLVRITNFVECGPVTAFHRDIHPYVLPFANLRWAWGTDVAWAEFARCNNLPIGIVDATPIRHLRQVATSYSGKLAREEGVEYLAQVGVCRRRSEILRTIKRIPYI